MLKYIWQKLLLSDSTRKTILSLMLSCFIIHGLICKFFWTLNNNLTSDWINPGLMSLEIWKYKNHFLSNYYIPSEYNNIFTDLIPFHLLPQILANFDPSAIRIMGFIIYILIIITFGYIVYVSSGNSINALIFAALFLNLGPISASWYPMPVSHNGTIFFVGLLILLSYKFKLNRSINLFIFMAILLLTFFSDYIVIAWFVIPYFSYCILIHNKLDQRKIELMILIILSLSFIYRIKSKNTEYFKNYGIQVRDWWSLFNIGIPHYMQGMIFLINDNIYSMIYESNHFILRNYFILVSFLILVFYGAKNTYNNRYEFPYFLFASAIFVTFIIYVGSNLSTELAVRYLTYSGISIFVLISLTYNKKIKLFLPLIFVLLISGAYLNFDSIADKDILPNQNEYDLINFLFENNLTYGFGDYWNSNLITYLSHEKVTIRPIYTINNSIHPFRFLSCERWFDILPVNTTEYFIISKRNDELLKSSSIDKFITTNYPKRQLTFRGYSIYVFEFNKLNLTELKQKGWAAG